MRGWRRRSRRPPQRRAVADLIKKNLRECCDGRGSVGQKAPQPLRHGDHPLSHGDRRNDTIHKMRGGLRHVPTVAGGADASALARERDHEPLAAARAEGTAKPEAEDAAFEIGTELLLDVARHGPLRLVAPLEPAHEVVGDDLVERRLLRAATLVAAAWRGAGMRPEAGPRGKPAEGSDHGRTGEWTGCVSACTLLAGCRPPPAGPSVQSPIVGLEERQHVRAAGRGPRARCRRAP